MSVIIRDSTGKITLYCKGADTIVFQRLAASSAMLRAETQRHLQDYGKDGLRTLVLAKKELDQATYDAWAAEYHDARFVWYTYTYITMLAGRMFVCGPLAQSAERRADNAKVVSSRLTRTIFFFFLVIAM